MKNKPLPSLTTAGTIARHLGVPIYRVEYVLTTRPHIQPAAYAGNTRLFDRAAIAMVRHELNAIEARRCHKQPKAD